MLKEAEVDPALRWPHLTKAVVKEGSQPNPVGNDISPPGIIRWLPLNEMALITFRMVGLTAETRRYGTGLTVDFGPDTRASLADSPNAEQVLRVARQVPQHR